MLTYHTAGDSHGEVLLGILEGFPAHVQLSEEQVNQMLAQRQSGYGRSKRQQIEQDKIQIVSGIWRWESTGAPIGFIIKNRASKPQDTVRPRTIPRPGHADLAGAWKYGWEHDFNPVIERSSARETAARTAIGAICFALLQQLGIDVLGHVKQIGPVTVETPNLSLVELRHRVEHSDFHSAQPGIESTLKELVDSARESGDSLGGIVEVIVEKAPPGLGGFEHQELRLDAQLAQALMSIPSVKGVEIGDGIQASYSHGSQVHDKIVLQQNEIQRETNRAGGIEGGISNGERIVVRAYHKPVPTMVQSIASVDLLRGEEKKAPYIRSDVVVIPAASVVAEAVVSFVIARAVLEKFGHDHLGDIKQSMDAYIKRLRYKKN